MQADSRKAGLDTRKVIGKLRALYKNGFVDRPVKGKYVITNKGKNALGK